MTRFIELSPLALAPLIPLVVVWAWGRALEQLATGIVAVADALRRVSKGAG